MELELTDHLGYEPSFGAARRHAGVARNGSTSKTLITEHGPVQIDTPRDRNGSFGPQIVRKRQRRFEGCDEKILALYSHWLSTSEIEAHLAEIYGVEVGNLRDRAEQRPLITKRAEISQVVTAVCEHHRQITNDASQVRGETDAA